MEVTVDGVKVEDAASFNAYLGNDSYPPSVSISAPTKLDNGLTKTVTYYSNAKEIGAALASISDKKTVKGFYGVDETQNAIRKYLKR
jgi:hypothetical protein